MSSFQNSGIIYVNGPLNSSPETYIYKEEGVGIIKITFESMGIH